MPMHDDPTSQLFADVYAVLLEEAPTPPSFRELADDGVRARPARVPRTPRWVWGVVAASVTLLVIGSMSLLVAPEPGTDPVAPTVAPTTTVPPLTTSAPPTTVSESIGSFAPGLEATGPLADPDLGGFGSIALEPGEWPVGSATFESWELSWNITWSRLLGWAINPDDPDQYRFPEGSHCTRFIPEEGLIVRTAACTDPTADTAVGRFKVDFSGDDQSWSVTLTDLADDQPLGTVTGSFPGLSGEEIVRHLVEEGRIGWYFVEADAERTQVEPPWYEYFQLGRDHWMVANDDGLVAAHITDTTPMDQWTIFRTENGTDWEEIGPAPWSSDESPCPPTNEHALLDTLTAVDGQLLAITSCEAQSWIDDGDIVVPGFFEVHYWSAPDGVTWNEIDKSDWNSLTDSRLPNWCEAPEFDQAEKAAACNQ